MKGDFIEQAKEYLPPYLRPDDQQKLFEELNRELSEINYYWRARFDEILQGDSWENLPIVLASSRGFESRNVKGLILSNTCDLDLSNPSPVKKNIVFCPIRSMDTYLSRLDDSQRESTAYSIRSQLVSNIFFLPAMPNLPGESMILFDDVHSLPRAEYNDSSNDRLFSLSQSGFYIFLIKLSIHFTRVQEGIARF